MAIFGDVMCGGSHEDSCLFKKEYSELRDESIARPHTAILTP